MKTTKYLALAFATVVLLGALSFLPNPVNQVAHAQGQYGLCVSSATAPGCQSSAYGDVVIAAAAQQVVVSTTAVTANSPIQVQYDYSLGTALGVTCNTTGQLPSISARVAGTSFTIHTGATFTTNPGCFSFRVIPQ